MKCHKGFFVTHLESPVNFRFPKKTTENEVTVTVMFVWRFASQSL